MKRKSKQTAMPRAFK